MNEFNHQKLFIAWIRANYPQTVVFAIPNGGKRDPITAKRLSDEGVLAGIPDLFIADGRPGLFIEMKEPTKGRTSACQKKMIVSLQQSGYQVAVCHGYEAAKQVFLEYINEQRI